MFPCWQGEVPRGFIVNFLGAVTRIEFYVGYSEIDRQYPADRWVQTEYPSFDEEYFEWIDLLEAVVAAKDCFTMLELGAGFGRWTANAALALKQAGDIKPTLIAVEAEPTHFRWMVQHLADNAVESKGVHLIQAAVAANSGKVGFYVGETEYGAPENWYGQNIGGPHMVDAVSLNSLLEPLEAIDLVDLDIQGAEFEVLEAVAAELDKKVKRVHIGTHSARIDEALTSLFGRLGWRCLRSYACGATVGTEYGSIFFQDGIQTWVNPAYGEGSDDILRVLGEKLETSRREGARLWRAIERLREDHAHMSEASASKLSVGTAPLSRIKRFLRKPWNDKRQIAGRKLRLLLGSAPSVVASGAVGNGAEERLGWGDPYETLRTKWVGVPVTTLDRMKTSDLFALPDQALLELWERARQEITTGVGFPRRGWYHTLYADGMRGKKVMDVGSGFGVDSITFAQHGAKLTFVDLVESNLRVLERLCNIMGLKDVRFVLLENVESLKPLDTDYDVIMAMGSLHNAPIEVMKPEYRELVRHLKVGGRWLQLAYPKARWIREGSPPFDVWGPMTDGPGTPWEEWYDLPKLLNILEPAKFEVVLYMEFHNSDFNWFDLLYQGDESGNALGA
jgi:FkbM family methyltransferase